MANEIKAIPEFTQDTPTVNQGIEEAVQPAPAEAVEETETPPAPLAEEKPPIKGDDSGEVENQVQGLLREKTELLKQIAELRGQRREIKQEELAQVDQKIEELKDIHPEDAAIIDRVLRSKGYVPKGEIEKMFYKAVQDEALQKFLEKYPEYKPENDPNDTNWSSLQKEMAWYKMPSNPHQVLDILERAHRAIKPHADRSLQIKKQQVQIAGAGSGGTQRSSSRTLQLDSRKRAILEQGGWSEEEIKNIEKNLE